MAADVWWCSGDLDQHNDIQAFCGKRFMGLSLCGKIGNGNLKGGSLRYFSSLWETVNVQRSRFDLDTWFEQKQKKQKPSQRLVMKKMKHLKKVQLFVIFIISEASSHYCGTCTTGREITVSMHHVWEAERLWGLVHVNLSFCISASLTLRGGKYYCMRTLGARSSYQVTQNHSFPPRHSLQTELGLITHCAFPGGRS